MVRDESRYDDRATAEAARVHPRMPVLFSGELRRAWLEAKKASNV